MKIIGLTGKAGSGKSVASQLLHDKFHYKRFSFADPIKNLAYEYFGWDGEKGVRGRRLLQVLGTEAGRNYDPDIWVKKLRHMILDYDRDQALFMEDTKIIIDDVRFDNEAGLVHELGGKVIRLEGASYYGDHDLGRHPSEIGVSNHLIDFVFYIPDCEGNIDKFNDIFLRNYLTIAEKKDYDNL